MPRLNIIILDRNPNDPTVFTYVLWADVPVARQSFYANINAKSAWKDALAADNVNLQTGAVAELQDTLRVPNGATLAQIKAFLEQRWADFQSKVTSGNPWVYYGTTWNGTLWTNAGAT